LPVHENEPPPVRFGTKGDGTRQVEAALRRATRGMAMDRIPLRDDELSLLCDIVQSPSLHLTAAKRLILDRLLERQLVEPATGPQDPAHARYRLTEQGQAMIDGLGIGITES